MNSAAEFLPTAMDLYTHTIDVNVDRGTSEAPRKKVGSFRTWYERIHDPFANLASAAAHLSSASWTARFK